MPKDVRFHHHSSHDPVYVVENKLSLLQIQELAKLCTNNLNFPEFTPGFFNHLKGECKFLLNLYEKTNRDNKYFDWETVDGAKEWKLKKDAALLNPKNNIVDGNNNNGVVNRITVFANWKKDPIERARRVWIWWKVHQKSFKYFSTAVRLIVLFQTSSCFVERVFSQLKHIIETCGKKQLEELFFLRISRRMNRKILQ